MGKRTKENDARHARYVGIPLATAGEVGYTAGVMRWYRVAGRWFYDGLGAHPAFCYRANVLVTAERPSGMRRKDFGQRWRAVVKNMLKAGARCVRVTVIGG